MLAKPEENTPKLPVLHIKDGEVFANSKDVAGYFGKRHDDILRAIRQLLTNLGASPQFCGNAFTSTTYKVEIGSGAKRDFPAFDMTKDGFVLLVMGFTGKEALAFKVAYIEEFNRMERELRGRPPEPAKLPPPPPTDPHKHTLVEADYSRIANSVMQALGTALCRTSSMMSEPVPEEPMPAQP